MAIQVSDAPETREIITLPDRETARMQLQRVEDFKRVVRELFISGHDFGVIPGTGDKPTLLKPGAEKLIKLLGLADLYDFLDKEEDWERGFFNYTIKCKLVSMQTGEVVAEGMGNCNSWESKYRYRWAFGSEVPEADRAGRKTKTINTRNGRATMYRLENDDVASQVNTILKMAKKRAQMDAALSAGRLSDVFTQDLEEIAENRRAASGEASDYAAPSTAEGNGATPVAEPRAEAPPAPPAVNGNAAKLVAEHLDKYQRGIRLLGGDEYRLDVARWELPSGATDDDVVAAIHSMDEAMKVADKAKVAAS